MLFAEYGGWASTGPQRIQPFVQFGKTVGRPPNCDMSLKILPSGGVDL